MENLPGKDRNYTLSTLCDRLAATQINLPLVLTDDEREGLREIGRSLRAISNACNAIRRVAGL